MLDALSSYQISKSGWDDYASKIKPNIRKLLKESFEALRDAGYYAPLVVGDEIECLVLTERLTPKDIQTKNVKIDDVNYRINVDYLTRNGKAAK